MAAVAALPGAGGGPTGDPVRERAVAEYKRKVAEHRDIEVKLKDSNLIIFIINYNMILYVKLFVGSVLMTFFYSISERTA